MAEIKIIPRGHGAPKLKGLLVPGTILKAKFHKKEYSALVDLEGRIVVDKRAYNSPSNAAKYIRKGDYDGWKFWKYQKSDGKWIHIDHLRKHK